MTERRFVTRGGVKELAPAVHRSSLGEACPPGRDGRAHRGTLHGTAGLSCGDGSLPYPRRPGIPSLPDIRSYRPSVGTRILHKFQTSRCRIVKEFVKGNWRLLSGPPFLGLQPLLLVMAVPAETGLLHVEGISSHPCVCINKVRTAAIRAMISLSNVQESLSPPVPPPHF